MQSPTMKVSKATWDVIRRFPSKEKILALQVLGQEVKDKAGIAIDSVMMATCLYLIEAGRADEIEDARTRLRLLRERHEKPLLLCVRAVALRHRDMSALLEEHVAHLPRVAEAPALRIP